MNDNGINIEININAFEKSKKHFNLWSCVTHYWIIGSFKNIDIDYIWRSHSKIVIIEIVYFKENVLLAKKWMNILQYICM